MALSLKESRAVADIAELLYDFLPGSGNPSWKNHVSFKTVAQNVGVGNFWQPGSKRPMITTLLERTLLNRRELFERLILEIVRAGITYRQKGNSPISDEEIEQLNGLLMDVGFKFPDLWDPDFLASLRIGGRERARKHVERAISEERLKETELSRRSLELADLEREFYILCSSSNRQDAGLSLESILNRLFNLNGLSPREPFRLVGEQIDGSFEFQHEIYLLEAKWTKDPLPEADLLVFRGKVEKSKFTRGLFVSINGITEEAATAITHAKQPSFFVMDGYDLTMVLTDRVDLKEFLRQRQRLLAEEGRVSVPFKQIWS
jgi:hypothetical protein